MAALVLEKLQEATLCEAVCSIHGACCPHYFIWTWRLSTHYVDLWCSCSMAFIHLSSSCSVVQVMYFSIWFNFIDNSYNINVFLTGFLLMTVSVWMKKSKLFTKLLDFINFPIYVLCWSQNDKQQVCKVIVSIFIAWHFLIYC